jgi:hypothetical protein
MKDFKLLPKWLQDCWKLAPAIARPAEKEIEELKDRLETALEKVRQYEMLIENKEK